MNTTALAIIQPDELDTIQRTAKLLAASGYFGTSDDAIVGMAQVAAKILAGRELGFGPFAAVNGIHLIQGKPAVGANLMAAAVRSHPRYDYRVKELTDKVCELEFYDNGKPAGISRFTIQEAATAELTTGKNGLTWKKYPRNMLFARAMSNGVRWYTPDIFSGNVVYVPEELDVAVDGDGNVVDASYTPLPVQPSSKPQPVTVVKDVPSEPELIQRPDLPVESNGDVIFEREKKPSLPHQRLFGVGLSTFGPDWNDGARAWIIGNWTANVAKTKLRTSAADLSNDEKDMLADYIHENATGLQKKWRAYKAAEMQSTGELEAQPA